MFGSQFFYRRLKKAICKAYQLVKHVCQKNQDNKNKGQMLFSARRRFIDIDEPDDIAVELGVGFHKMVCPTLAFYGGTK
jgi:hypothetical protein